MNSNPLQTIKNNKKVILFIGVFFIALFIFMATFEFIMDFYAAVFLKPLSYMTYYTLKLSGMNVTINSDNFHYGYCDLLLPKQTLRINYGCVGIYALFILLSGILAFPSALKSKLAGIAVALPAFYIYSFLRLVIMGIAGRLGPQYLNFFHSYFMLIINVAFILFLFIFWIEKIKPKYES